MRLEAEALLGVLQGLGPHGTQPNKAGKYVAFGVIRKNKFFIAVSVEPKGTKFFTEDQGLLDSLAAEKIVSEPCNTGRRRDKNRHLFPELTIDQVQDSKYKDSFIKLVQDSISLKERGF